MTQLISLDDIQVGVNFQQINPCRLNGCNDLCCRETDFNMSKDEWFNYRSSIEYMFPETYFKEVGYKLLTGFLTIRDNSFLPDGIYFAFRANRVFVSVKGACPFLSEIEGCLVHNNEKIQPSACRKFELEGSNCKALREEDLEL